MRETSKLNLLEKINKTLETRNSNKYFSQTTLEFVEIFNAHYSIYERLNSICNVLTEEVTLEELNRIKAVLEQNINKLYEMIEKESNRKIQLHYIESEDSIWQISKKFKSDAAEIYELNDLKKIYSLEGKKILLIPIKI